jgi:amino acid transporter
MEREQIIRDYLTLIEEYHDQIAAVFDKLGITDPVDAISVVSAYNKYDNLFIVLFAKELIPQKSGATEGEGSGTDWGAILGAAAGVIGSFAGLFGKKETQQNAVPPAADPAKDPKKPNTNTYIIIGVVAVVLVLMIVLLTKKK